MNINNTNNARINNLNKLLQQYKNLHKFTLKTGIDYARLYRALNHERFFTDKLAREIEQAIGVPQGWLDNANSSDIEVLENTHTNTIILHVYHHHV